MNMNLSSCAMNMNMNLSYPVLIENFFKNETALVSCASGIKCLFCGIAKLLALSFNHLSSFAIVSLFCSLRLLSTFFNGDRAQSCLAPNIIVFIADNSLGCSQKFPHVNKKTSVGVVSTREGQVVLPSCRL